MTCALPLHLALPSCARLVPFIFRRACKMLPTSSRMPNFFYLVRSQCLYFTSRVPNAFYLARAPCLLSYVARAGCFYPFPCVLDALTVLRCMSLRPQVQCSRFAAPCALVFTLSAHPRGLMFTLFTHPCALMFTLSAPPCAFELYLVCASVRASCLPWRPNLRMMIL